MAPPLDDAFVRPGLELLGADRSGIAGISVAYENEPGGNSRFLEFPGGFDELDYALVAKHPGSKDDDGNALGLGGRDVGVDVDTRAFDQNGLSRGRILF